MVRAGSRLNPTLGAKSAALFDFIDAAEDLTELLQEARGEYMYDIVDVKRWILGAGGKSGNCEICVDNADMGWIGDDDVFEGTDGDVDGPPAHPHCECTLEYGEKRKRVYV